MGSCRRKSNFFDKFRLFGTRFHTKVKFGLLSEKLKRTDHVLLPREKKLLFFRLRLLGNESNLVLLCCSEQPP
ncbi:hypothetical protein F0328_18985 [Citrobacter portucalensis]|nr:hypothetical protein F0328_18985 [Citrobacter portucalensis]